MSNPSKGGALSKAEGCNLILLVEEISIVHSHCVIVVGHMGHKETVMETVSLIIPPKCEAIIGRHPLFTPAVKVRPCVK